MLRFLCRVRTLMILVVVAASALSAKVHLVDRPASRRRAEYFNIQAQAHASAALDLEAMIGVNVAPGAYNEAREHRILEQRYSEATHHPDDPNELRDAEARFLVRSQVELTKKLDACRRRISERVAVRGK